jgi:hypothetical protein
MRGLEVQRAGVCYPILLPSLTFEARANESYNANRPQMRAIQGVRSGASETRTRDLLGAI